MRYVMQTNSSVAAANFADPEKSSILHKRPFFAFITAKNGLLCSSEAKTKTGRGRV